MSRYVDIEPYEEYVLQRHYRNSMGECIETVPLCGLPIADVAEVRHGRWIPITKDGIVPAEFLCSVCGRKLSHSGVRDMVSIHYPYCHCGAKMDEVEE